MGGPESSRRPDRWPDDSAARVESAISVFVSSRLSKGGRVCVGLSGGLDSVVLLEALCCAASRHTPAIGVEAVHVHHGLNVRADAWAAFCVEFCDRLGVPVEVVRVRVPRDTGEGLEAAARRCRHEVFAQRRADWVALAHHRDDQAETMLLHLLRGAGVAGAAGMVTERPQGAGPALARPLLDVSRAAIAAYAAQRRLRWIEDDSNDDRHFRRNFLRHEIFPRIETSFPGARRAMARAARHFAAAAALLDALAEIDRTSLETADGGLALAGMNALSADRARNLLHYVWRRAGFRAPETAWVDEAIGQLSTADATSELCVATAEGELHVYRGGVHIVPVRLLPPGEPILWTGQDVVPWGSGRVRFTATVGTGIGRDRLDGATVHLAARHGGERLRPDAKRPRRSLRNLLQERGVPPWERARLPFLWIGDRLAWVGGIGCDVEVVCADGEPGLLPVWEPR